MFYKHIKQGKIAISIINHPCYIVAEFVLCMVGVIVDIFRSDT